MGLATERVTLSVVRDADVIFGAMNPAVDTKAIGQCIKKDGPGIVTGRCPIARLPQLSMISWAERADLCLGCDNKKLNGIENEILPGRLDYGSTNSLGEAIKRDLQRMAALPKDCDVREELAILTQARVVSN